MLWVVLASLLVLDRAQQSEDTNSAHSAQPELLKICWLEGLCHDLALTVFHFFERDEDDPIHL